MSTEQYRESIMAKKIVLLQPPRFLLPTVVKLFPIKYDDLLSSDILGNCDLTSVISVIEDFVPSMKKDALYLLDSCKKEVTQFYMTCPSLRADGEGKPSLLSVVIPIQIVKVIETFDHYEGDDFEAGHSHGLIDEKYLQTPEMDRFLSRRYSSFFSSLTMKKFDGANDSAGECSICLQDYDEKNDGDSISLVELPCTHVFHTRCVIRSLDAKARCPACRHRFQVQPLHTCSRGGEYSPMPFILSDL